MDYVRNLLPPGSSRPASLRVDECYLLFEAAVVDSPATFRQVLFVAYDACPAYVIVSGEEGMATRCLRQDLWASPGLAPPEPEGPGLGGCSKDDLP